MSFRRGLMASCRTNFNIPIGALIEYIPISLYNSGVKVAGARDQ